MSTSTASYIAADAYPYECSCGERYSTVDAAYYCRKCRVYCVFGYCTHVVDVRDDSVVRGFKPSEERYAVAAASYEKRIEAERKEFEAEMLEMSARELAAHPARAGLDAAMQQRAAEEEEDMMYAIQDDMSGVRARC